MPIQVSCSACHASFNAPDSAAGKRAKCPKCGGTIEIPTIAAAEEIVDAEEQPNRPFDEDEYEVEPPGATTATEGRKPCPMCGEMIQQDAVKCRFCGEIFDPVLKGQQLKKSKAGDASADLTPLEWLVAIFCCGIGFICGIVWLIQDNPKAKKMILVSLWPAYLYGVLFVIGFVVGLFRAIMHH